MDLEEVWRIREEEIYPQLFGSVSRGIFPLTMELFAERFRLEEVDPRWLHYGVIEFAPTAERPSWLYVTSGHSNPWDEAPDAYNPGGPSGSGIEFIFASTQQGDWAISFLQNMLAFDLLLSAGCFPEGAPLEVGDRIPLRTPINGIEGCRICNAVLTAPYTLPADMTLPSGTVSFMAFTGITDQESAYAREHDSDELVRHLRAAGYCPVTDPERPSLF